MDRVAQNGPMNNSARWWRDQLGVQFPRAQQARALKLPRRYILCLASDDRVQAGCAGVQSPQHLDAVVNLCVCM